jgi:hypothetical protein
MAIKVITGLPSGGKTYFMTQLAKEALANNVPVYSNYKLGYADESTPEGVYYWSTFDDLEDVESGLIIIDEMPVYFNSRAWEKFSLQQQYKFQQHAKEGLNIIGTTQHQDRVDVVIREIVSVWINCRRIGGFGRVSSYPWGWIKASYFWPEEFKKADGVPYYSEYTWVKRSVATFYNTLEKIPTPTPKDVVLVKFKRCAACGAMKKLG